MNIVIVIDLTDTPTNGPVMTAKRFAEGLKKRGHCVNTVGIGAEGENDFPVLSRASGKNRIRFDKFEKAKIKSAFEGADIVHFIFPFRFEKKCKRLADEMGIPTASAFHVQPENISCNIRLGKSRIFNRLIYGYFKKTFHSRFTRIHCPSNFIADRLRGYGGELYVISSGYDGAFAPAEEKCVNSKFEIVMVGRFAPEKNQKVLISAVAKSKHRDEIHLTLLGNGSCKRLQKQAEKENVDVSFGFLPKEKLIRKLQQSDLYVHPASVEIEAVDCIEAIACGLVPVIADSRLSATSQLALDKRSLFADGDALSLAGKIDYWFENEAERVRMGRVYAEYANRFRPDKSLEQAEEMFNDRIHSTLR